VRKLLVTLLVLGICILGATQLAFATGTTRSPRGTAPDCFLNLLPEETREQVESIIKDYHDKMTALHDEMQAYRESGDKENLMEIRDEMWELKQEMREAITPYVPEEFKEQYANREPGMRHTNRCEGRSFKHGWKGSRGPFGVTDSDSM
jgi:hypothetical protein